jgi:micrococcal nuclease
MTQPNRLQKKLIKRLFGLLLFLLGSLIISQYPSITAPDVKGAFINNSPPGFYLVTEVFDGDTIAVSMNGKIEKIRLIGVDTPETHHPKKPVECFGQAASNFLNNQLAGKSVRLESDPESNNRDVYGRLLRYVYLENNELINKVIISAGYGFAYTHFPFEKMEEFRQAEADARNNNLGLWEACPTKNTS